MVFSDAAAAVVVAVVKAAAAVVLEAGAAVWERRSNVLALVNMYLMEQRVDMLFFF